MAFPIHVQYETRFSHAVETRYRFPSIGGESGDLLRLCSTMQLSGNDAYKKYGSAEVQKTNCM